jgi:hypothetical protein
MRICNTLHIPIPLDLSALRRGTVVGRLALCLRTKDANVAAIDGRTSRRAINLDVDGQQSSE